MVKFPFELVGIQEIRKMLGGVSKQQIHYLMETKQITPIQKLACGHIFLKREVERFIKQRKK